MAKSEDIDGAISKWPYEPGTLTARSVRAADGREVVQMRIELGLLQMEARDRPDGQTPGGQPSYLEYLIQESIRLGEAFSLSEEQCVEADREFLQFYHRRICWLALRQFDRAIGDADHTLGLMDFVLEHSHDEDWAVSHEKYRPFVLLHRTQAAAMAKLEEAGPQAAVEEIGRGLGRIRESFQCSRSEEAFDPEEIFGQLEELQDWLRDRYDVGRTLAEQLTDAVAAEQYELAAQLRDKIAHRQPGR